MKAWLELGTLAAMAGVAVGAELAPPGGRPLSEVLKAAEDRGVSQITEATLDDGVWEIEARRDQQPVELKLHPVTLAVIEEHPDSQSVAPPTEGLTAREIALAVEKAGYGLVVEIDRARQYWEVEAYRQSGRRKLHVSPADGRILSDRADD